MNNLLKNYYKGFSYLKSIGNIADGMVLNTINNLIYPEAKRDLKEYVTNLKSLKPKIDKLIEQDSENLSQNMYKSHDSILNEAYSKIVVFPQLLIDSVAATKRRINNKHKDFDSEIEQTLKDLPEYYTRNFHFQTNGYLSEKSADLYKYQVDILFAGLADVMRRQMIALLKKNSNLNDKIKILEIGCGAGELSKYLSSAFPQAEITCVDLSPNYLAKAKKDLSDSSNLTFMKMNGESLDFKDNTFDLVFSCYLFHELPHDIRIKVLNEASRVLVKDGYLALSDSLQLNDDVELNWALDKFPIDFHEPFFKNYVSKPLKIDLENSKFKFIAEDYYFLTKTIIGKK